MGAVSRGVQCIAALMGMSAVSCLAADAARDPSAPYDFVDWSATSDGAAVAYVVTSREDDTSLLRYQNFSAGKTKQLFRKSLERPMAQSMSPRFSPDGTQLAYLLPSDDGHWRLHIWSMDSDQTQVFTERVPCSFAEEICGANHLQWAPDGSRVYYLAVPAGYRNQFSASVDRSTVVWKPVNEWLSLHYRDPDHGGVSVRESAGASGALQSYEANTKRADLVSVEPSRARVTTLAENLPVRDFELSPDGQSVLVTAMPGWEKQARQSWFDYYIVPTDGAASVTAIKPALERVRQTYVSTRAAWSPDSSRIAFIEDGEADASELKVLDARSGAVTRIYQGTLEGSLSWAADGQSIHALRRERRGEGWQTQLWTAGVAGKATHVTAGTTLDASLPLTVDSLIVAARLVDGTSGLVNLAEGGTTPRVLAPAKAAFYGAPVLLPQQHSALFIRAGDNASQEIFSIDLSNGRVRQRTFINAGAEGPKYTVHRVRWNSRGQSFKGRVYTNSKRPAPVIALIYPRRPDELVASGEPVGTELASARNLMKPLGQLLEKGYSIFVPELIATGEGHACADVAMDLDAGLNELDRAGVADATRAAVMGHSFGGWAVNCVITRTDRFKAAVSLSGVSNLFAGAFSGIGSAASWSLNGGQTSIGSGIWQSPDLFWRESPVSGVHEVSTPLLLVHGKRDNQVPYDQSVMMYVALAQLGKVVTLVGYDDSGHNITRHPDYAGRVLDWVQKYLGPLRSSP